MRTPILAGMLAVLLCACNGESDQGDAPYLLDIADVHLKHGRYEEALETYQEAKKQAKDDTLKGRAEYGMALVSIAREDPAGAVPHMRRSIEYAPETGKGRLQVELVSVLRRAEMEGEAEKEIDEILASQQDTKVRTQAYRELTLLYRERMEELVQRVEGRLEKAPGDRGWLAFLGDLYAEVLQKPEKAIEVYDRLLKVDPQNVVLLDRLFGLALRVRDLEKSNLYGSRLAGMLEREPRLKIGVLRLLAAAHLQAKKYERALELLGQCEEIASDEQRPVIRREIYKVHDDAGTLAAEVERLEKEEGLEDLWIVHSAVKPDWEKALAVAEKMLEKKKDDPRAMRAVVIAAANARKDERVAEAGGKLLEASPAGAAEIAGTYAAAMQRLGRSEDAVKILESVAAKERGVQPACFLAIATLRPAERASWHTKAVRSAQGNAALCLATAGGLRLADAPVEALAAAEAGLSLSPVRDLRVGLQWERILALERVGRLAEAEQDCRKLAKDMDAPAEVRQAAERQLVTLLQKQGKSVRIEEENGK